MSNNDHFIDEVSEELRRDRLFLLFKRWGWVAALAVIVLVGGAAFNEYRKASQRADAEALGTALREVAVAGDPETRRAAIASLPEEGDVDVLVALMQAAVLEPADPQSPAEGEAAQSEAAAENATPDAAALEPEAVAELEALAAGSDDASALYRQLAALKLVMLEGGRLSPEDRLARLEPLTVPGAPFRLLAQEQKALILVETGQREEAVALAQELLGDEEMTPGLRRRLSQLIVALGGQVEAT